MNIIIDNKLLKPYDDNYYVSEYGDIYSKYSKKFLKHYIDHDGYHRVDIHSKHIKIHKLVYITWVDNNLSANLQINHKDDNKDNNHYSNLYAGSQKENIHDCIKNNHRKGNIKYLTIYDKDCDKILTFSSVKNFIDYCGHPSKGGSIKKFFNKNWFKKRFVVIDYNKGCRD